MTDDEVEMVRARSLHLIDIRSILCPIDFSESSRHALEHAATLAQWYGARITVLHVTELFPMPAVLPGNPSGVFGVLVSRDEVIADIRKFTDPLKDCGVPVEIDLREGTVVRTILDAATTLPADLVVMGTHGRGGVEHLMLGSVTEKVLRKAPCPVLVVPSSADSAQTSVRVERILCPVDFAPSSMKALTYALSLAQEADATLTLLHVLEAIPDESVAAPFDIVAHHRMREEGARERLRAAIPDAARDWCHPVEVVASGKTYREILRVAGETRPNLIVMGVAGHNVIERLFFGSTASHVVRQAPCPVLTLRS
jgi:nucleotide-binding universal stress UspA family protein